MTNINVVNFKTHTPTENDIYIGRGSILGNPYTYLPLNETSAKFQAKTQK